MTYAPHEHSQVHGKPNTKEGRRLGKGEAVMEGRAKPRDNLGVKTVWKTAVDGKEDLRPRAYDPTSHERVGERTLRRESKSKEKEKPSDFIKSAKVKSLPSGQTIQARPRTKWQRSFVSKGRGLNWEGTGLVAWDQGLARE
jgi:hypothetical protein